MRSLNSEETLKLFVKNLREGIYITTASGEIVDCNQAFLDMFGVSSLSELRGYTASKLVMDPHQRDRELSILNEKGAVREYELEIRRPDGASRIVLDTAYRVTDPASGEVLYHGILVDITERKRLERELREQAIRDPLTGCYNRHYLAEISAKLEQKGGSWGTIVLDVDHFKECNDRYGHSYGDKVLVQIGRFLMREIRSEDPVFRTGGDEFVILLPGRSQDEMLEVTGRLREKGPIAAPVSFTLGWAIREKQESIEETTRRADQQLIFIRVRERQVQSRRSPEDSGTIPPG